MADQAVPLGGVSWSSSLSVAELAAVREAGFQPRGLVMGSSVYHLGISYSPNDYYTMTYGNAGPWGGGGGFGGQGFGGQGFGSRSVGSGFPGWLKYYSRDELGLGGGWGGGGGMTGFGVGYAPAAVCWERGVFETGMETAASLALDRIEAETASLGAHGVIGTRLNFRYLQDMPSTLEFTAIGTAVARAGARPLPRPFTSHLTGQELLKLLQAGLVPVTVAVGAGSITAEITAMTPGGSYELTPFGDAIETSRRFAAERLERAARSAGWAVLGTMASTGMEGEAHGRVMTTILTGTVVRRFAKGKWDSLPLTVMRLSK
jgi:uncharacterized protein YbjQ (UPF0145 family)